MKKTRYVILGLLLEEDLSGYEIKKIIDIRMSFFWQESYGQIYPEISRMKEEGLIDYLDTADSAEQALAKREKTKYKITAKGREELHQWMQAENEKDTTRSEFLLKMYFSTDQNLSDMKKHILRFMEQSEQKLQLFQMFDSELKKIADMHNNHRQILYVLDLGIRQAKLYVDWSREMLEHIEKNNESY